MFKSLIYSISAWIIPSIILITLVFAVVKKIPVYETFIDGAKDGLKVTVGIIPYLIAIITAVSMLRASGAIDLAARAFSGCLDYFKIPVDVVPIMFIRSLSGSAVLGLFSEIAGNFGPDAYATKLAAIMVGSSETTFYVLSVYFWCGRCKKIPALSLCGCFC